MQFDGNHIDVLQDEGCSIVPTIYSEKEIAEICKVIRSADLADVGVSRTRDLFAIRELLIQVPELNELIWNEKMLNLIESFGEGFFLTKAIYFDKPKKSNWFVAYHQDLIINVSNRVKEQGFINWTNKKGQIGVQPPEEFLCSTITLRIHLDDTDHTNGALRVIPKSHLLGIRKTECLSVTEEEVCFVERGGIMLMKPLLMHASNRSTGQRNRRVIHLEICNKELPKSLKWKEKSVIHY